MPIPKKRKLFTYNEKSIDENYNHIYNLEINGF